MKPMTASATLASIVGTSPMPRTEVTSKLWGYIKKHGLQDKSNRRIINADERLRPLFGGRSRVSSAEVEDRVRSLLEARKAPHGVVLKAHLLPKIR